MNNKESDEAIRNGTHAGHCCVKHGCKYGEKDCPVVYGWVKQVGPCEGCPEGTSGEFVEVRIGRPQGNVRENVVTIVFKQGRSKTEVELSLEEFALVVTGAGGVLGAIRKPRKR